MNRRRVAHCLIFLALTVGSIGACSRGSWVGVTSIFALARQDVIYDADLKVFVVASTPTPLAVAGWSPRSDDRSDRVLYCRSSETFVSALGEVFDRRGIYYGGPAPRSLDRFALEIDGDQILVNPDAVLRGPDQRESKPLQPAGQFCGEDATEVEPGFLMTPSR